MTPQDYITNRLARIREEMPDPICYPIAHERLQAQRAELEAMQAHLSQSTRPEPSRSSIGGQYSVAEGQTCWYLMRDGFYLARSTGAETLEQFHHLASDLNQLEALRASHGELYSLLREHEESRSYGGERARRYCLSPLSSNTRQALTKAQSLIHPTKTPTAAPQGQ